MSDAEWAVVRPLLPVPGRGGPGRAGQPEAHCQRAMLDAIRYLVDNGTKWRARPADHPPWDRVYAFFRRRLNHDLVLWPEGFAGSRCPVRCIARRRTAARTGRTRAVRQRGEVSCRAP
ncbi:transposase [Streptomyces sp. NPDC002039]|uniref:transposase n=1 Tax=Streptomyces sp. NPDC002039 TaxID=3154660 RepID=UPI00333452A9